MLPLGAETYILIEDKAAAILESTVINHPFIDGNKRTAYALSRIFLSLENFDLEASQNEKYEMTIQASKGQIRFDEIKLWIKSRLISNI
jgi:death on curing protein